MITSLRLVDFKNFADETLNLGPFTLIVGTNASGKSNIRDAFRFLKGIGIGYSLAEILGGKYGDGGQLEWAGIRGAMNEVARLGSDKTPLPRTFSLTAEMNHAGRNTLYSINVGYNPSESNRFRVLEEELKIQTGPVYKFEGALEPKHRLTFGSQDVTQVEISVSQPILVQLFQNRDIWTEFNPETEEDTAKIIRSIKERSIRHDVVFNTLMFLLRMRFLEFVPAIMRWPSVEGANRLGESGDNLPTVLEAICSDKQRGETIASWLRELTPMDVIEFGFPRDPSGRIHLQLVEKSGRHISADSASDGTLRFLGILASLLSTEAEGLYFIEEIDNGIHPSRLHLLIDLIERQTAKNGIQVVATTHSPDVLNLMNDTTFKNTSVVYRDEDSADAVIRQVARLPKARELRKSQGLGRLHAGGWIEDVLAFESADAEAVE